MKPTPETSDVGFFNSRRRAAFLAGGSSVSSFSKNRPVVEQSAIGRFLFDVGASMARGYGVAGISATRPMPKTDDDRRLPNYRLGDL